MQRRVRNKKFQKQARILRQYLFVVVRMMLNASGPGKEHTNDVVCTCLRGHFRHERISRENLENVPVSRQIRETARLHRKVMRGLDEKIPSE